MLQKKPSYLEPYICVKMAEFLFFIASIMMLVLTILFMNANSVASFRTFEYVLPMIMSTIGVFIYVCKYHSAVKISLL